MPLWWSYWRFNFLFVFVLFETNTENEVCVRELHFRWWARDREVAREPESRCRALLPYPMAHVRRHARAISYACATAARTAKSFRALLVFEFGLLGRILFRPRSARPPCRAWAPSGPQAPTFPLLRAADAIGLRHRSTCGTIERTGQNEDWRSARRRHGSRVHCASHRARLPPPARMRSTAKAPIGKTPQTQIVSRLPDAAIWRHQC